MTDRRPAGWWAGAARRLRAARRMAGVRGYVALLLLVAAVPLLLLAVVIVWQNARLVAGTARDRAAVLRAGEAARIETVLDAAWQYLGDLAAAPGLTGTDPIACAATLEQARVWRPARFTDLSVLDSAGRPGCGMAAGGATMAAAPWFRALAEGGRHRSEVLDLPPPPAVTLALARDGAGGFGGALVVRVALSRLAPPATEPARFVWLVDAAGRMLPLGGAPAAALPAPAVLRQLLAADTALAAGHSADGRQAAFAVAPLDDALRLLVATDATADVAMAQRALLRRIAGLVLLLGAGLAAVALGANLTLVVPIKQLSTAVQTWREGGRFAPGSRRGVPLELRRLAASFATAARALEEREQQLQRATAQQELLMQEIHHRVKNNLQIIASLLNLQASRIRVPEARRAFATARDRIRALATLHRHLYAHGDLHTINMRSFLHELCDQLLTALGETAGSRIQLRIEAPELQISSDQAVPMALIVTETVSNAAKYAFPDGRRGQIRVALSAEDGRARLVIEDDGVGLPDQPGDAEGGQRDGIGLHLIRGFARQLGGRLTVTQAQAQAQGTRYELDLDLALHRDLSAAEAELPA